MAPPILLGRVWGVSTLYDLGAGILSWATAFPNCEFEDGSTVGELMHDGHGMLLDFDGNAAMKILTSEYDGRIQYVSGR